MKERHNQREYFPDTLQAEAMVQAVTSLLEKNSWTTAVLGTCCGTATAQCPGAPQAGRRVPRKGHASLSRGHSHTKIIFFMPLEQSLCS